MDTVGMVDCSLAERVQRLVAPVAVRLELLDCTSPFVANRHAPVGDLVVRDRRALLGLIVNPNLWFGEAIRCRPTSHPRRGRARGRSAVAAVGPGRAVAQRRHAALASPNTLRYAATQHPPPLRSRQRLLRALARSPDCLHLRVLSDPGDVARGGAAGEVRSRVPQAPASRPARHVLEAAAAGGARAAHGATLRRDASRRSTSRASRSRFARERAAARRPRPAAWSSSTTTIATSRASTTPSSPSGMLEHVGLRHYRTPGRGDRPLPARRRRPRAASLHRPRRARVR